MYRDKQHWNCRLHCSFLAFKDVTTVSQSVSQATEP